MPSIRLLVGGGKIYECLRFTICTQKLSTECCEFKKVQLSKSSVQNPSLLSFISRLKTWLFEF